MVCDSQAVKMLAHAAFAMARPDSWTCNKSHLFDWHLLFIWKPYENPKNHYIFVWMQRLHEGLYGIPFQFIISARNSHQAILCPYKDSKFCTLIWISEQQFQIASCFETCSNLHLRKDQNGASARKQILPNYQRTFFRRKNGVELHQLRLQWS